MPTDRSQFIVPAGLELEHGPDGLVIRFPGDVVLDAPLGPRVRLIESRGGDISFGADVEVDEIIALSGKVTARAGLRVRSLSAADVQVRGPLRADVVVGRSLRLEGGATCGQITALAGDLVMQGVVRVSGDVVVDHGDLICHSDFTAANVRAGGRVVLRGPSELGRVEAGRELLAQAAVRADQLLAGAAIECLDNVEARVARAETIRLSGPRSEIKQVQARALIAVGAGKVTGDVFIAPVVDLAARTTGRITVIESHNELGASAVSGKLRLSELGTLISDVDAFLRDRGMTRLDEAPAPWPERPPARPTAAPRPAVEAAPPAVQPAAPLRSAAQPAAPPASPAGAAPAVPAFSAPSSPPSSADAAPTPAAPVGPASAPETPEVDAAELFAAGALALGSAAPLVSPEASPARALTLAGSAPAGGPSPTPAAAPITPSEGPSEAPVALPPVPVGEAVSAGLGARAARRPAPPPPPPLITPRVETLEEILAAYPGLLGPIASSTPAPRPAAPPVGIDPLAELEWWSEELNSGPTAPPAELRPEELRAAAEGAAPLAGDLEGELLATSALEADLRAAGLIDPAQPAPRPADLGASARVAAPPPPPSPAAAAAVDWTAPTSNAEAEPEGAAWLDAAALDASLLDQSTELDEGALDADLLMDAADLGPEGAAAPLAPPPAPTVGPETRPALDDLNLDDLNLDTLRPADPLFAVPGVDGLGADGGGAAGVAARSPEAAEAPAPGGLDLAGPAPVVGRAFTGGAGAPGHEPLTEEAVTAQAGAWHGDELLTGELKLPDLGDLSSMDEETLLRKLIEHPVGAFGAIAAIAGGVAPPPVVPAKPTEPSTEELRIAEELAAAAFDFEPSPDEGEGGSAPIEVAAPPPSAAPPAPVEPLSPALRPARPHVPLTDAPSLSFVSPRALVGADPAPEEALFDVPPLSVDDEVAAQLADLAEVESGPLALGGAEGPEQLRDPADSGVVFDMGGPADLHEDAFDPPTEGNRSWVGPDATVEEVPVRPPGGPLPVGMGQLMLMEEPSGGLDAAAAARGAPAAPVVDAAPPTPLAPPAPPVAAPAARRPPPVGLSPISAPTLPVPPPRLATVEEEEDEPERSAPITPARRAAPAPVAAPPPAAPPLTPPASPAAAPAPAAANRDVAADPVLSLMFETLGRIRGAYAGGPVPPPVDDIAALLRTQDYGRIRGEFPPLVTALIDHHRSAGGSVNPKVSHQLRIIDTLVRNL
jgi:hypothetical protein